MKIRITHDAIRVRLNQTEVKTLGSGQSVEMETKFSKTTSLRSAVRPGRIDQTSVSLEAFSLMIDVPHAQLVAWANSEDITIESQQMIASGHQLRLLIEKDFHCVHRENADDADTFPNPKLR